MTNADIAALTAMINKLRAEASRRGGVTSREVFDLTDSMMDLLARAEREPKP